MSAFDRSAEDRLAALRAVRNRLGDDDSEVAQEVRHGDRAVDAVLTRQKEGVEEAAASGEPLEGDRLSVYSWFDRVDRRHPEDLYDTHQTDADEEIVASLLADGYLEECSDGTMAAVPVRGTDLIGLTFVDESFFSDKYDPFHGVSWLDEHWLVIEDELADEVIGEVSWYRDHGLGILSVSDERPTATVVVHAESDCVEDEGAALALANRLTSRSDEKDE